MEIDLKKFDLEDWWKMLAGAGAAIAVASIAVKFPPTIFVGLGILSAGIGEWINHPYQEYLVSQAYKLSGHPRSPRPAGLALDILGAVLVLAGLAKLVAA